MGPIPQLTYAILAGAERLDCGQAGGRGGGADAFFGGEGYQAAGGAVAE